ncbi:MAG: hypothetical protein K2M30_03855 [Desulfovibrionaceae bacterium]|nr:hypothetical protein [Desulfovibrionaceae bacterium]
MTWFIVSLVFFSCVEIALFFALVLFYKKVKTSENLVANLYKNQHTFLQMLNENSSFEQEFEKSFAQHIEHLRALDRETRKRIERLESLLSHADTFIQSPAVLRETILQGLRQGISKERLAHTTGISIQEVEIIATRYSSDSLH